MSDASLSASDFPQSSLIDATSNDSDEIDSLPSEADSDDVTISEDYSESDAEREWRESLQQLELLLSMVIVPYLGKYFGRKFAYWGEIHIITEAYSTNERLQAGNPSWSGSTLFPSLSQTGEGSIQWVPSKLLHRYEHEVLHLLVGVKYTFRSCSPASLIREDTLELHHSSDMLS
jgi:hypothetical protein